VIAIFAGKVFVTAPLRVADLDAGNLDTGFKAVFVAASCAQSGKGCRSGNAAAHGTFRVLAGARLSPFDRAALPAIWKLGYLP
jgi:hypothetical protein